MPLETKYLDLIDALCPCEMNAPMRERLSSLYDLVVETNQRINITSLVSPIDVALKHIADSLSLFYCRELTLALTADARFCDVGCGGGFPGLPLACAAPELSLTMIDSTEKKILALKENALRLGLRNVAPLWGRGEELALPKGAMRERFDVCVSRAVASLPVLCELCLPFVKFGGYFVAMKGQRATEELDAAKRAIPMLGGVCKEVLEIPMPPKFPELLVFSSEEREKIDSFLTAKRYLIVIQKKKPTTSIYPRKWSQMTKKPL